MESTPNQFQPSQAPEQIPQQPPQQNMAMENESAEVSHQPLISSEQPSMGQNAEQVVVEQNLQTGAQNSVTAQSPQDPQVQQMQQQVYQINQMPMQYGQPGQMGQMLGAPGIAGLGAQIPAILQYQPHESQLEELNTLIEQSFSPDNQTQQMVYQKLQELEAQNVDQLCINLSFLVGHERCSLPVRQVAGLTLKAQIEKYFAQLQMTTIEYVKSQSKHIFASVDIKIAKTVSQVMALIMLRGGFNLWPDLLQFLTANLEKECFTDSPQKNQENMGIIDNSIHTIAIIVEDCSKLFEDVKFRGLITEMFPPICKLISSSFNQNIVQNAINTINMLLLTNTEIIIASTDEYLNVLLNLGTQIYQQNEATGVQSNQKVKWRVVQGITTIMEFKMNSIIDRYEVVCQLMIGALMHKDQQVALAASEFWSGIIQNKLDENDEVRVQKIQSSMERILSALLECCVMSNADRMGDLPLKDSDISHIEAKALENDDDEDDGSESEQDNYTTLRKSSAFTLQQFSKNFPDIVFDKIQNYLQNMLQNDNEDLQEAAILALGAISDQDGSYCAIEVHLESLVPFLIQKLDGNSKDVRATTCWTLSKFSEWIGNTDADNIFLNYHQKIVEKMADSDENVQEAACNAYSSLVEIVPEKCQPLLISLFQQLNSVVENYKAGPLITMFDCVGSIAQAVGEGLNNNEILGTLLPLLNKKWEQFSDNDRSLLTLFECFESVVFAIKEAIEPYAKNIFDRCVKILTNVLTNIKNDYENLFVETDFYIRSMDLISSIFTSLNQKAEPIVMQSNLIVVLREFLDIRDLCIKQYVFAMVGDLQKHLGACIKDKLPEFITCAIQNLFYNHQLIDPTQNQLTVCNNACWCLGEMAVSPTNKEAIKPYTEEIVQKLTIIFQGQRLNKSLAQNIAITLGRLGLLDPEAVAKHLGKVAKQWCVSLRYLKGDDNDEKYQAYKGLCYTIGRNTKAIAQDFPYFCSAIVHYKNPRPELNEIFKGMLQVFKQSCGEEGWNEYMSKFPEDLKRNMIYRF